MSKEKKCFNPECENITKNPKYCSRNCAASHINRINPRRKLGKRYCESCGKNLPRRNYKDRRRYCDKCNPNITDWYKVTLGEVIRLRSYQKHSRIRDLARSKYIREGRPQKCEICAYDKHFEVHHIKSIESFKLETPIAVVNALYNLIGLCPNCHWEADNGLINVGVMRDIADGDR